MAHRTLLAWTVGKAEVALLSVTFSGTAHELVTIRFERQFVNVRTFLLESFGIGIHFFSSYRSVLRTHYEAIRPLNTLKLFRPLSGRPPRLLRTAQETTKQ